MPSITLAQIALFLAAAAIAAPLAKALRIGTVLGYLLAGVLIGPLAQFYISLNSASLCCSS
jgi:monovalent cation:H+ antiporter-2, CPA2 family